MKVTVQRPVEIEVKSIVIDIPVRYDEEDIPNDFPLRVGDQWRAEVDLETGQIADWPVGKTGDMYMKVCDSGTYTIKGPVGDVLATIENDYVPHGVVPGEFGDYVKLDIDANGVITNWPDQIDLSEFPGFAAQED